MSRKYLIILSSIGLILGSCLKPHDTYNDPSQHSFIAKARQFFDSTIRNSKYVTVNYKSSMPRVVQWDRMEVLKYSSGYALTAPIIFQKPLYIKEKSKNLIFHLEDLTQLLIYEGNDKLHLEVITKYPDSNYLKDLSKTFTGLASVDDWWGNNLGKYLLDGTQIKKYKPTDIQTESVVRTCTVIYGYNYSPGDPDGGYSWVEESNCYYTFLPISQDGATSGGLGGGIGGGGGLPASLVVKIATIPPDNPIANIADYLKCFTNVGGSDHTYSVTVCVQQPVPGSRAAYKWVDGGPIGSSGEGNIVNVGHTFLIFSERAGGNTITRNLGLYPATDVKPGSSVAQGQLNDDETHSYNISATFNVTNGQFFNMLNFVAQGNNPGFNYNLNSENCTTFAIQTLAQAGIMLPITIGTWPRGMGCNPGDLGEDIRQMPNITKSTVQNFHPNVGNCL